MSDPKTHDSGDDFWDFPDEAPPSNGAPASVARQEPGASPGLRATGHPFRAELDVSEIDDRQRPTPPWAARAVELSRSRLAFLSRRMAYTGRQLLVAVHLIDEQPVALAGTVAECTYDADGLYRIDINLMPFPQDMASQRWISERGR